MARRKNTGVDSETTPEATIASEPAQLTSSEPDTEVVENAPSDTLDPVLSEAKATEPKESILTRSPEEQGIKEKQSKESIEAAIHEKLSNRSQEGQVDPFVPSAQLQNEVKQVAKLNGFPLSRGTEAGAALMARARRRAQS